MGLYVAGAVTVSPSKSILFPFSQSSPWRPSSLQSINCRTGFNRSGLRYHNKSSLRSSNFDDTSSGASEHVKDEPVGVITLNDTRPNEKTNYGENTQEKEPVDDSLKENQFQQFEILDKLDLKFDSDDTYSVLLLGGGALVTLYLATSIVGAIDSVPVVPKLLEVVGLSYTVWFTTRYLLFKKNREELAAKIEELKEQVLG